MGTSAQTIMKRCKGIVVQQRFCKSRNHETIMILQGSTILTEFDCDDFGIMYHDVVKKEFNRHFTGKTAPILGVGECGKKTFDPVHCMLNHDFANFNRLLQAENVTPIVVRDEDRKPLEDHHVILEYNRFMAMVLSGGEKKYYLPLAEVSKEKALSDTKSVKPGDWLSYNEADSVIYNCVFKEHNIQDDKVILKPLSKRGLFACELPPYVLNESPSRPVMAALNNVGNEVECMDTPCGDVESLVFSGINNPSKPNALKGKHLSVAPERGLSKNKIQKLGQIMVSGDLTVVLNEGKQYLLDNTSLDEHEALQVAGAKLIAMSGCRSVTRKSEGGGFVVRDTSAERAVSNKEM